MNAARALALLTLVSLGAPCGAQEPAPIWELLPDRSAATRAAAFSAARERTDPRDLAPLADLLRVARDANEWWALLDALQPFFSEDLRQQEGVWNLVTQAIAERIEDLPAYSDYPEWKGELLAQRIDPRFRRFFPEATPTRIRLEEAVWGGVAVDGIPSLDAPPVVPAAEADFLTPDEPVFGLAWNGEARAYPLRILDWHEMANDRLADVSFALAYCTLCGAGIAYRTDREGENALHFGSSGLLMRSNKLMFDRGTDSLWNQLTGEAVTGPMAALNAKLETLPVVLTSWDAWRQRHPETTVIDTATGFDRPYEIGAAYGRYFANPGTMFPAIGPTPSSRSPLQDKEQLFVVRHAGERTAFRRRDIEKEGLLHGRVGAMDLVLIGSRQADPRLPAGWIEALADQNPTPERFSDLRVETTLGLLRDPDRFAALDEATLLALPPAVRFAVLQEFAPEREGTTPRLSSTLRNRVALKALIAPVRAYESGGRIFRTTDREDRLTDANGHTWTATEDALLGPDGKRLSRLPGHLVFGLGWRAFLAKPNGR